MAVLLNAIHPDVRRRFADDRADVQPAGDRTSSLAPSGKADTALYAREKLEREIER